MGKFSKAILLLGVIFVALPFLGVVPSGSTSGISNNVLSWVIGALLLIIWFFMWKHARKRMKELHGPGQFMGAVKPSDARKMMAITNAQLRPA